MFITEYFLNKFYLPTWIGTYLTNLQNRKEVEQNVHSLHRMCTKHDFAVVVYRRNFRKYQRPEVFSRL